MYSPSQEITPELLIGKNTYIIQPRVLKSQAEQVKRTRDKAEVFTPSWICNQQNNMIDTAWFGRTNVFNCTNGTEWVSTTEKICFSYAKLFKLMIERKMKKKDLQEMTGISAASIAKLLRDEYVRMDILVKICAVFHVQPSDVVEIIYG